MNKHAIRFPGWRDRESVPLGEPDRGKSRRINGEEPQAQAGNPLGRNAGRNAAPAEAHQNLIYCIF
jgi:hypothetical protein